MAGPPPDHYRTLGVARHATAREVRAAFRALARRYHPDLHPGDHEAEARFKAVTAAYAVLGDPGKRWAYDQRTDWGGAARPARPRGPVLLGVACLLLAIGLLGLVWARAAAPLAGARPDRPAPAIPTRVERAAGAPGAPAPPPPAPPATPGPRPSPTPSPPPTATAAPPATPRPAPTPPAAAPAGEPPAPTPSPAPAPPAARPPAPPPGPAPFPATDWIGVAVPVNLRAGPGVAYPSRGVLAPGTLLAATGERQVVGGVLWRQFALPDGRVGWIRDVDVLPVRE